jgi:hypothetical protein
MDRLFATAEMEAAGMGEAHPGLEYLVLSALRLPDGSARRTFQRIGADPDAFGASLVEQHDDALRSIGIEPNDGAVDADPPEPAVSKRPIPFEPPTREVFQEVVALVRKEKSQIYGAYIVLVAAGREHGTTARTLEMMDVDREALATAARAEIDVLNDTRP